PPPSSTLFPSTPLFRSVSRTCWYATATGESPVAVAYQHVRETPAPPSSLDPGIDRYVDAVVMQSMAKNPENRYDSAGDMRSDLRSEEHTSELQSRFDIV